MKLAIMQPYFFPYIGYFQLMNAVDQYVIYDNIQYTKKGWINRNRILVNGQDAYITLPLKHDSDFCCVYERSLADSWPTEKKKLLNRIYNSYRRAPYFVKAMSVIEAAVNSDKTNLFGFIYDSLLPIREYLNITTPLITSSTVDIDHSLKAEEKVIALCKKLYAWEYINAIGGVGLYDRDQFTSNCIHLHFIKSGEIKYKQFDNDFVPSLSIVDVMMFNSQEQITEMLNNYSLV